MRRTSFIRAASSQERSILGTKVPLIALRQILAVSHYGSFRHAAQALGVSQSSISARVKSLEEEIGIILLDRNTRGVRLTSAGREFVDQVEEAMEILDAAIKAAGSRARGQEGGLRIRINALFPGGFLDKLLERFQKEHCLIDIHICEGTTRDAQKMLREGRLDIAFTTNDHEPSDLHSQVVWYDRLVAAIPEAHPLAHRDSVTWLDLSKEKFLARDCGNGPQVEEVIFARSAHRWPTPEVRSFNVSMSTLLSMVALQRGVTVVVAETAGSLAPGVAFLPISDELESIAFSALWSPRNQNPVLKKLLAVARNIERSQT